MAEKKGQTIVIKKITINSAGAHGGSWKVAFADFMTAMMAFFLVMWLLGSNAETKKSVARYFSGPSVIEQQFNIYGAELTLEKLFLDLVNEPLKTLQSFVQPSDVTPDVASLGSKRAILYNIASELGELAENVQVTTDEIKFDLPDSVFFERNTADPNSNFRSTMENLKDLVVGLENSYLDITSEVYTRSFPGQDINNAESVAAKRLDLIRNQIDFQSDSNTLRSRSFATGTLRSPGAPGGYIRIRIKQKEFLPDGSRSRPIKSDLEPNQSTSAVYNDFVKKISESKRSR